MSFIKYNPFKIIAYIQRILYQRREFRRILDEKGNYLLNGRYFLNIETKTIWTLKDQKPLDFIEANSKHLLRENKKTGEPLNKRIKRLINLPFNVKNNDNKLKLYQGSLVMVTGKNNVKIFDYEKNKIITFFDDDMQEYYNRKDIYTFYKEHFKIPKMEFQDESLISIEDYINFIPFNKWSQYDISNSYENIFDRYIDYCSQSYKKGEFNIVSVERVMNGTNGLENEKLIDTLYSIVSKDYKSDTIIRMSLHGDLNYRNVLFSNNDFYFIDWEFTRELIFFYDVINLIFLEAASYNNYFLLDKFLLGKYDDKFYDLFASVGAQYYPSKKLYYITIYVAEYMKSLDLREKEHAHGDTQDKYLQVIKRISEYQSYASIMSRRNEV